MSRIISVFPIFAFFSSGGKFSANPGDRGALIGLACAPMRKPVLRSSVALVVLAGLSGPTPTVQALAFDFASGNSAVEIIIPAVVPPLFQTTAPNDAPIILRHTTLITNAWFDAIAPYHPTAVGVYSQLGRRPAAEAADNTRKNIAMFYASYRVLNSLMPRFAGNWRAMLESVGLDPDDASEDLTTPVGIGNVAGRTVAAVRERDGMNQLGDEGGKVYDRRPYEDYTGYAPLNTPYDLRDPSRWQPLMNTPGNGTFSIQQFVTPQWARTRPYSYDKPDRFNVPVPNDSNHHRVQAYRAQADHVMSIQAALTDEQKMIAELFDNKISSLGFSALFVAVSRGMSLDEFVHYDFLTNVAAFDGGIATWNEKFRYDAVRPVNAIRYLYRNQLVTGWGGPGRGTVSDLPGTEWRTYLPTGNHPEYPSGSSCFCAAHAQASRRFLGSDAFGWSVTVAAGSSVIEPGVTPATDITLGPWDTFTEFDRVCSLSRVQGGVHFVPATTASQELCRPIGDLAFEFVDRHIKGITP